jgi:hypothetical protein
MIDLENANKKISDLEKTIAVFENKKAIEH